MLTQHVYWNLDAFKDDSQDVLSHLLHVDSSQMLDVDGGFIPTGKFVDIAGTPFDFKNQRSLLSKWHSTLDIIEQGN